MAQSTLLDSERRYVAADSSEVATTVRDAAMTTLSTARPVRRAPLPIWIVPFKVVPYFISLQSPPTLPPRPPHPDPALLACVRPGRVATVRGHGRLQ